MNPRAIITAKKPALTLVPSYYLRARENGESEAAILDQTREFLLSLDEKYRDHEDLSLYVQSLAACYAGLYDAAHGE